MPHVTSRVRLAPLFIVATLLLSVEARSDGGAVRLQRSAGAFTTTVFTPPDPIAAGPIDVSVLVQDRADGSAVLDGVVTLRLTSPSEDADRVLEATATHDAATNKLLYAAWIDVGAGQWDLRVAVQRGGETASVDSPLSVVPATMPLADYWPHLLLPPIAIVVFVLHQCLVGSRRSLA